MNKNTVALVMAATIASANALAQHTALDISNEWVKTEPNTIRSEGNPVYQFGSGLPKLVCAPLKTCLITLQEGEIIQTDGIQVGDNVRWHVAPTVSGTPTGGRQTHLVVKPTDTDLATSLTVVTDRRVYTLALESQASRWMPSIKFDYPEIAAANLAAYHAAMAVEKKIQTLDTGERADELDFNYRLKGKAHFKPLRVYNNGSKTIIEMPKSIESGELPTVLVINGKNQEIVNYRYMESRVINGRSINGRFVVDQLSPVLALVLGVGNNQEIITVERI
ncbi:MAG: P-type conjugative transfer protein TrbG [Ferrimonas sp.]